MPAPKANITSAKLNTAGTGVIVQWIYVGDCGFWLGMGDDWTVVFLYNTAGREIAKKDYLPSNQGTVTLPVPTGEIVTSTWYVEVRRYCNSWTSQSFSQATQLIDTSEFQAAQATMTNPIGFKDGIPICPAGMEWSTAYKACVTPTKVAPPPGAPFEIPWTLIIGGVVGIGVLWFLLAPPPGKPPRIVRIVRPIARGVRALPEAFRREEEEVVEY